MKKEKTTSISTPLPKTWTEQFKASVMSATSSADAMLSSASHRMSSASELFGAGMSSFTGTATASAESAKKTSPAAAAASAKSTAESSRKPAPKNEHKVKRKRSKAKAHVSPPANTGRTSGRSIMTFTKESLTLCSDTARTAVIGVSSRAVAAKDFAVHSFNASGARVAPVVRRHVHEHTAAGLAAVFLLSSLLLVWLLFRGGRKDKKKATATVPQDGGITVDATHGGGNTCSATASRRDVDPSRMKKDESRRASSNFVDTHGTGGKQDADVKIVTSSGRKSPSATTPMSGSCGTSGESGANSVLSHGGNTSSAGTDIPWAADSNAIADMAIAEGGSSTAEEFSTPDIGALASDTADDADNGRIAAANAFADDRTKDLPVKESRGMLMPSSKAASVEGYVPGVAAIEDEESEDASLTHQATRRLSFPLMSNPFRSRQRSDRDESEAIAVASAARPADTAPVADAPGRESKVSGLQTSGVGGPGTVPDVGEEEEEEDTHKLLPLATGNTGNVDGGPSTPDTPSAVGAQTALMVAIGTEREEGTSEKSFAAGVAEDLGAKKTVTPSAVEENNHFAASAASGGVAGKIEGFPAPKSVEAFPAAADESGIIYDNDWEATAEAVLTGASHQCGVVLATAEGSRDAWVGRDVGEPPAGDGLAPAQQHGDAIESFVDPSSFGEDTHGAAKPDTSAAASSLSVPPEDIASVSALPPAAASVIPATDQLPIGGVNGKVDTRSMADNTATSPFVTTEAGAKAVATSAGGGVVGAVSSASEETETEEEEMSVVMLYSRKEQQQAHERRRGVSAAAAAESRIDNAFAAIGSSAVEPLERNSRFKTAITPSAAKLLEDVSPSPEHSQRASTGSSFFRRRKTGDGEDLASPTESQRGRENSSASRRKSLKRLLSLKSFRRGSSKPGEKEEK